MFNSLFNSLFGKSQDNTNLNSSDDNNSSQDTDQTYVVKEINSNVTAIFLEEDNDWLFVEKENDEKDSTSSERSPKNLQLVPFQSILSHLGSISENDENSFLSANLPSLYPSSMDDSWFLTPPECFSSISSIQLESSPLENLLIEHPSMSVYYNFRRGYNNAIGDRDNVIDDLVVLELSQHDMEEEQTEKVEKLPVYILLAFH
jgi:hypothetical protein